MSAWSDNFDEAPKDRHILVRCDLWDCEAIMYWLVEEEFQGWDFAEQALSEMSDVLTDEELAHSKWAPIPT